MTDRTTPFKRPASDPRETVTDRGHPPPMTLNVLIARLIDLRDIHGGGMRVVLRIIDESPDGAPILLEPTPQVVDLAAEWPDSAAWFADDNDDTKVAVL